MTELRLLCVLAHPDDESLGTGGILARYAAEGIATYLLTATSGQAGWTGHPAEHPGPDSLGHIREQELRNAATALGVRELLLLDYVDGELDQAPGYEVIAAISRVIRTLRPDVVVTFGPEGATGHPDHIAISQHTTAAIVNAADQYYDGARNLEPHRVAKLYYLAESVNKVAAFDAIFGDSAMQVDGVRRTFPGWPDWAITTRVDTTAYWHQVWAAISCHRSQLLNFAALEGLAPERHAYLWGTQEYYRVFSLVNNGRAGEDDLFAGLRS